MTEDNKKLLYDWKPGTIKPVYKLANTICVKGGEMNTKQRIEQLLGMLVDKRLQGEYRQDLDKVIDMYELEIEDIASDLEDLARDIEDQLLGR